MISALSGIMSTVQKVLILMLKALIFLFGSNCHGISKVNFYLLTQAIFIFILFLVLCYISHQLQVFYHLSLHTCPPTFF